MLFIAVMTLLGFTLGATAEPVATEPADEAVARHEAALARLEARLDSLRSKLSGNLLYREALLEELRGLEQDIDDLSRANRQLETMADAQRLALAATLGQLQRVRAELAQARTALAELVRTAYGMGRGDQVRLLLGQEDPHRAERIFGYYQVIAATRIERVEQVRALERELNRLEQQERADAERLARLASSQDQTRARLSSALSARGVILRDLEQVIAEDQAQAAIVAADAQALRALIEKLKREAEIADEIDLIQAALGERKGGLAWPLSQTRLLRRFGEGREQGALHADGVLLAAEPGTEVRAVHHGRVVYADWLRGFGMLMVIDHGDDDMTLYGHNQALLKEVGEWVANGDVIALAGRSGGTELKGLYFAIRHRGQAVDPARWCSPAPARAQT
jgi:septal ring factor EnvC (AmiA/AmiB activator)